MSYHVSAHQKVTSAEEEFSNQVVRPNLWTVSLFPQPFLPLPSEPMNQAAMMAEMGVVHGLNMDFHAPRLTWLQLLLTARYANNRDQH